MLAISFGQGNVGQPAANLLLVVGMDIVDVANVGGLRHACARNLQGRHLRFPQERQAGALVAVRSDLHKIERLVLVVPQLAPTVDQRPHFLGVQHAFTIVRFTLVPQRTTNAIRHQRRNHAVVQGQGGLHVDVPLVVLGGKGVELVGNILQSGHALETFGGGPGFNAGTAPIGTNEAYWHIGKFFVLAQVQRKEVAHGGEIANCLGGGHFPSLGGDIRFGLGGGALRDFDMANERVIAIQSFLGGVGRDVDSPLHVGLAAAQPHFTHQNIGEGLF